MDENVFVNTENMLDDASVREVEQELGIQMPEHVKRHYLRFNGGSPTRYLYKKEASLYVVQEFLPMKYGSGRLEASARNLAGIIPAHLIPFAVDPGGDYFCFSTRPADEGSIWIYRGEYFDDPDRATQFLSISLPDFLDNMIEDEQ